MALIQIRVQQLWKLSPVSLHIHGRKAGLPLFKSEPNLIIRHAEKKISMEYQDGLFFLLLNVRATIMESGRASF
jgi:hypothetical protein